MMKSRLIKALLTLGLLSTCVQLHAYVFEAVMYDTSEVLIDSSDTLLTIEVTDTNASPCILYRETFNLDLSAATGTEGKVSVILGNGAGSVDGSLAGSFTDALKNEGVTFSGVRPDTSGCTFTPTSEAPRYLRVSFDDDNGGVNLEEEIGFVLLRPAAQANLASRALVADEADFVKFGGTAKPLPSLTGNGDFLGIDGAGNLIWTDPVSGSITSVTAVSPLIASGTPAVSLSLPPADTSTNGYLTSADWNTFNDKQNPITTGSATQYLKGDLSLGTLDTDVVSEGAGNLYFTTARAQSATVVNSTGGSETNQAPSVIAMKNYVAASSVQTFNGRTGAVTAVANDYNASQIQNIPAGNIAATDVQSALNELDTEKQDNLGFIPLSTTGDFMTGVLMMQGQNEVRFGDSDSSNFIALRSPGTVLTDTTFTLPDSAGSANQVLATDGVGNLSWTTPSGFTPSNGDYNWTQIANGAGVYFGYMPNNTACGDGQLLAWDSGNSRWNCSAPPIDNDTLYTSGAGLNLTATTFSIAPQGVTNTMISGIGADCTVGQVLKADGAGGFSCGADLDSTYNPGNGLTISGNTFDVNVGTSANQIVQLDGTGMLPILDGSNLTNLPPPAASTIGTSQIVDSSITGNKLAMNSVTFDKLSTAGVTTGEILVYSGSSWVTSLPVSSSEANNQSIYDSNNDGTGEFTIFSGSDPVLHFQNSGSAILPNKVTIGTTSLVHTPPGALHVMGPPQGGFEDLVAIERDQATPGDGFSANINLRKHYSSAVPNSNEKIVELRGGFLNDIGAQKMFPFIALRAGSDPTNENQLEFLTTNDGTTSTPKMIIASNGFVGIGTNTPTESLHIIGNVLSTGTVTQASDERFKKNIELIPDALAKIMEINGMSYDWRMDEFPENKFFDRRDIGVIAQDVERVFPEAVVEGKDGFKSVSYTKLVAPLIEATKELNRELSSVKEENKLLKSYLCAKDPEAPFCE